MKIRGVVRCDLATGEETLLLLPRPMFIDVAICWAYELGGEDYRYWPDLPPVEHGNKIEVFEDYYFIVLGREEARALISLSGRQRVAGQLQQKLRTKHLVDTKGHLTAQGRRLAEKLACNQLQLLA